MVTQLTSDRARAVETWLAADTSSRDDLAAGSRLLAARARAFCITSNVDVLGTFRIPADALAGAARHPDLDPAVRLFLPRLSGGEALSRGERYYDVGSALRAWPVLLGACRRLTDDEADGPVALALYENLFNAVAAMTFSYWERCSDEPEDLAERGPILASLLSVLPEVAQLHLGAALGQDLGAPTPAVDWEHLNWVGARFPRGWRLRSLREFDSKPRVVNELLYLTSEVRAVWPFQAVLFPLYGALTLAAYFPTLERLRGAPSSDGPLPSVLIRVGRYDRGETCYRSPDGSLEVDRLLPRTRLDDARRALHGNRVLVVDDNAATGHTLRACREFVLQLGGVPCTRSAETSWELLERRQRGRACLEGVDLPGLRTNMSHALQCTLVDLLLRRQWDEYAERADLLELGDFSARLHENYRTARSRGKLLPRQRWSVEHELAHARRHWREEPGYPSASSLVDPRLWRLPREGFPEGVVPRFLRAPRRVGSDALAGGLRIGGADFYVLAAAAASRVRIAVPGPGRLQLSLGDWSTLRVVSPGESRRRAVDVEVMAPVTPGGHELVLRLWAPDGALAERRCPVHVVQPRPVSGAVRLVGGGATAAAIRGLGALLEGADSSAAQGSEARRRPSAPLVVAEGALTPDTAPLLRAALEARATALVLAQQPDATRALPIAARLVPAPLDDGGLIRFTTAHDALASLPRHRVLGIEDARVLPNAVFTRLGTGPWADEVAVGVLAADGLVRGTVIGAHPVGGGRLIVCQLRLAEPAAAGHPGACALLADLLRWAAASPRKLLRENVVLADGRSMSFYPFESTS